MAATEIKVTQAKRNEFAELPATVAVSAADGATVVYDGQADHCVLLIVENAATAEKAVTIKKGNGVQGVADLEFSVPASGKQMIVLESAKFVNVSGENMGKVVILGADANIKVAAVALP